VLVQALSDDDDSEFARDVGKRLAEVRAARGLSQKEFAAELGIPIATYQRYEYGSRELPLNLAWRLMKAHGVSPAWLMAGTECGPPQFMTRDALSAFLEDLFTAWGKPIAKSGVPVSFAELEAGWRSVIRAGLENGQVPASEIQYIHKRLLK